MFHGCYSVHLLEAVYQVPDCMSGTPIADVSSTDVPICRHSTRLWAWSSSSPLIFLYSSTLAVPRTRTRTARVEQFTGHYKTDHQLRTVWATYENTFIRGPEITAHCDSSALYRYSYLLTYIAVRWVCVWYFRWWQSSRVVCQILTQRQIHPRCHTRQVSPSLTYLLPVCVCCCHLLWNTVFSPHLNFAIFLRRKFAAF